MQHRLDAMRIAALPEGLRLSGWFGSVSLVCFVWLAVPSEQWSMIFGALPDTLVAGAASSRMRRPAASSALSARLSTHAYKYLAHQRVLYPLSWALYSYKSLRDEYYVLLYAHTVWLYLDYF